MLEAVARLVQALTREGLVSESVSKQLRDAMRMRNAIVHGFSAKVDMQAANDILEVVRQLRAA